MSAYTEQAPARAEVDAFSGVTVLQFGTNWCGFCNAAEPHIAQALQEFRVTHPELRHFKVEDGPGRPLGRSFKVKLWPTVIFIKDGAERARVVRPDSAEAVTDAARQLDLP
ncbi:thioredoxin family protein [Steroidobacter sp. S1-65]|uniref:Thioredoxin family protein n=1 Tax=Steroidobacter gossypii TaxID=2805490 RepID=A0ABS1X294_9GAMM|nr:thioredoxin family protein [Steroidobacter gossypii]MBM0107331.1 thioredoxin family protein [Steroidobacter gossypii]